MERIDGIVVTEELLAEYFLPNFWIKPNDTIPDFELILLNEGQKKYFKNIFEESILIGILIITCDFDVH